MTTVTSNSNLQQLAYKALSLDLTVEGNFSSYTEIFLAILQHHHNTLNKSSWGKKITIPKSYKDGIGYMVMQYISWAL